MKRRDLLHLGLVAFLFEAASSLHAQSPFTVPNNFSQSPIGPTTSPYLNLLRRNTPAYLNYYGLVKPEFEARKSIQNLQNQVAFTQQQIDMNTDPTGQTLITGRKTQFLSTGSYFGTGVATPGASGSRRNGFSTMGNSSFRPQLNTTVGNQAGSRPSVGGALPAGNLGGRR